MSLKKSALLVAAFGFAGHGFAQADDTTLTTVHTLAKSMNLGLEYNAGLTFSDNKFTEVTGRDAKTTSVINQNTANVKISGKLTDSADYFFRFNSDHGWDYAKVTWWANDMLGVTAGRDKVKQGGLEARRSGYATIADSYYHDYLSPFRSYADTISLQVKAAGTLSLQLVNDQGSGTSTTVTTGPGADGEYGTADDDTYVVDPSKRYDNLSNQQPATILEWAGQSFGGVMPLIQVGLYDYKSMYFTVSGAYTMNGVDMALSVVSDQRNYQTVDAAGKKTDEKNAITSVTAEGTFQTGSFRPFAKIAYVDVKQNPTNAKANSSDSFIDDNGMMIHLGVFGPEQGLMIRPYAALTYQSAKFAKSATEEETRSNMALSVGIAGEI